MSDSVIDSLLNIVDQIDASVKQHAQDQRALILDAPTAALLVEGDRIVVANDPAKALFQRRLEGLHIDELVPVHVRPAHAEHRKSFMQGQGVARIMASRPVTVLVGDEERKVLVALTRIEDQVLVSVEEVEADRDVE